MAGRTQVLYVGRAARLDVDDLSVREVSSVSAALEEVDEVDCVVSAQRLEDGTGLELLRAVREDHPDLPFILYPAAETADERVASEAISAGVTDYYRRDGTDEGELAHHITEAVDGTRRAANRSETPREVAEGAETVLGRVSDAFFALDESWRFTHLNDRAAELIDVDADAIIGKNVWDEFPEATERAFYDEYHRAMESQERVSFTEHYPPLDTWFEVTAYPSETGLSVYFRDVTERIERERELEATRETLESERAFFESALDAFDDVFYVLDTEGYPLRWNDRAPEVTGYPEDELEELHVLEFVPETDHDRVATALDRIFEGSVETLETELVTRDGERIPVVVNGAPMTDEEGEVTGIVGSARDITDQKRRERALEEARRRFDLAVQASNVTVWEYDLETDVVHIPGSQESQLGLGDAYDFETLLGRIHPEDGERFERDIRRAPEEGTIDVTYRVRVDGEVRWLHTQGKSHDETTVIGATRDITERKRREQELERFEVLSEESTDVNAVLDEDGTFRYLTPSVERVLGYQPEELVGEQAFEYIHPEDREEIESVFFDPVEETERPTREFRFARADGSWAVIEATGRNLLDDPDIEGIVVYTRDITERVEREREREATAQAFHGLYDAVSDPEASFEQTLDRLLDLGREYLDVELGFLNRIEDGVQTVERVRGDHPRLEEGDEAPLERSYCRWTLESSGHWDVHDALEEGLADDPAYETFGLGCYAGGVVTVGGDSHGTLCFADEDPREPFSEVETALVDLLAQWVSFELERRALESERERLAFLNRLVRHDLLNDLNVVHGRARLLDDEVGESEQPHLDLVVDRTEKMIDLVETVRSLMQAIVEDPQLESVDLEAVLRGEIEAAERTADHAEIRLVDAADVTVRADELLGQVFENLLGNAIEHGATTPLDGRQPNPLVEVSVEADAEHVTVHVADDGPGMPDDLKEAALERGAKAGESAGTGVGLYLVSQLVDAYGGEVTIADNDPTGTVVSVTLPRA